MEQNSEETTAAPAEGAANETPAQAAPPRRRASRRVSTAAGAAAESASQTAAEPAAADSAPAASDAAPADSVAAGTDSATGGEAAAGTETAAEPAPKKRATRSRKKPAEDADAAPADATAQPAAAAAAEAPAGGEAAAEAPAEAAEPKKRATRSRKKTVETEATSAETDAQPGETSADIAAAEAAETAASDAAEAIDAEPAKKTGGRGRKTRTADAAKTSGTSSEQQGETQSESAGEQTADEAGSKQEQSDGGSNGRRRRGRGQKNDATENDSAGAENGDRADAGKSGETRGSESARGSENGKGRDGGKSKGRESGKQQDGGRSEKDERSDGERNGNGKNASDGSSRSTRTRQRDRKRRGQNDDLEPEIAEDDVLLPVAGILDVLDNYAFVRTTGYLPGPNDVYVSLGQVKKYGLRRGDAVVGAIRQPREGEGGGRQKYNAIVKIDAVNGRAVEDDQQRVDFADLTPLYPQEPLRLESSPERSTQRVIDLIAPVGKGQRALVTGSRGTGKSAVLREIAEGVSANAPDAHLMVVLVDERPEEVTDLQRTVKGEVVASTFDRAAEDHVTVAELAVERAKRLVELGHDVVVLLDSLTALGHAYSQSAQGAGRGGNDRLEAALHPVKKLLGAARNIENGGSLTIVATALTKTGSETDEAILRELVGTANSRLRLSRKLAEKRLFPAVKLGDSSTDREDLLLGETELQAADALRRGLGRDSAAEALESLLKSIADTPSNTLVLRAGARAGGAS